MWAPRWCTCLISRESIYSALRKQKGQQSLPDSSHWREVKFEHWLLSSCSLARHLFVELYKQHCNSTVTSVHGLVTWFDLIAKRWTRFPKIWDWKLLKGTFIYSRVQKQWQEELDFVFWCYNMQTCFWHYCNCYVNTLTVDEVIFSFCCCHSAHRTQVTFEGLNWVN